MVNRKSISSLLALALTTSCIPHNTRTSDNKLTNGVALLVTAGIVTAGAAAYKLHSSLSIDTQKLLADTQKTQDNITTRFAPAFALIDTHQDPRILDEKTLASCAAAGLARQPGEISSTITALTKSIESLEKAITKAKDTAAQDALKTRLQEVVESHTQLHAIQTVLRTHELYFPQFQRKSIIAHEFAKLIEFANRHLENNSSPWRENAALHYELNGLLTLDGSSEALKYPYLTFAKHSCTALKELEEIIAQTSSLYPVLAQDAKNVATKLHSLHAFVVNSPDYKKNEENFIKNDRANKELAQQKEHYKELQNIERERLKEERHCLQTVLACSEQLKQLELDLKTTKTSEKLYQAKANEKIAGLENAIRKLHTEIHKLQQADLHAKTNHASSCMAHNGLVEYCKILEARLKLLEEQTQKPPAYQSVVTPQQPPAYQEGN